MKSLFLPAITGKYGRWRYYQIIMRVKDIVANLSGDRDAPKYRIRTFEEVEEIYSVNINEMLQRVFDPKRLAPIRDYLLRQPQRYINNLTVVIYGGDPEWLPMDVAPVSQQPETEDPENSLAEITKDFGIIKLTEEEVLFALDGQHRLKGLRAAVAARRSLGNDQIAITLLSHESTPAGKERTRRLFTTLNRYAKPVSLGENILLDEDDVSAIVVRQLIQKYGAFRNRDLIAFSKTADLKLPTDAEKFSTVVALYNINEMLLDKSVYPQFEGPRGNLVRVRPSDATIDRERQKVWTFWNSFFRTFPQARQFVSRPTATARNRGGPLSLRPIGQQLFAEYYIVARSTPGFPFNRINRVPDELANPFWRKVLYNPTTGTMLKNASYARSYLFFQLGIPLTGSERRRLTENLRRYRGAKRLPTPLFPTFDG